jgi:hypothetical protein
MPTIKFTPDKGEAYAKSPVCVKVMPGVREQLMAIDNYQELTRQFWAGLIESEKGAKAP